MTTKVLAPRVYWTNFLWLMGLLALTWGLGYVNFGVFNLPIALFISFAKTILIVLFSCTSKEAAGFFISRP